MCDQVVVMATDEREGRRVSLEVQDLFSVCKGIDYCILHVLLYKYTVFTTAAVKNS